MDALKAVEDAVTIFIYKLKAGSVQALSLLRGDALGGYDAHLVEQSVDFLHGMVVFFVLTQAVHDYGIQACFFQQPNYFILLEIVMFQGV